MAGKSRSKARAGEGILPPVRKALRPFAGVVIALLGFGVWWTMSSPDFMRTMYRDSWLLDAAPLPGMYLVVAGFILALVVPLGLVGPLLVPPLLVGIGIWLAVSRSTRAVTVAIVVVCWDTFLVALGLGAVFARRGAEPGQDLVVALVLGLTVRVGLLVLLSAAYRKP